MNFDLKYNSIFFIKYLDLDFQIVFIKNMDLDYKSDPNIWI